MSNPLQEGDKGNNPSVQRLAVLVAIVALALGALLGGCWGNQGRGLPEHAGTSVDAGRVSSEAGALPTPSLVEAEETLPSFGESVSPAMIPPAEVGAEPLRPSQVLPSAEGPAVPAGPVLPTPYVPLLPPKRLGQRTVVLDPGHGGEEVGAVHRSASGEADVVEKAINLRIAFRLRELLEAEGFRVVLTREDDSRALPEEALAEIQGMRRTRADLQARVDIANAAQADLFLSIHNNGSSSPAESGTEVWYDPNRPFAERNLAFAELLQEQIVGALRTLGYPVRDRGIKSDATFRVWQGRAFPIFVLGPPRTEPSPTRATQMPGALLEALFVSNPADAAALRRDEVPAAIAQGIRDAILRYFQRFP